MVAKVQFPSFASLLLGIIHNESTIGSATGFLTLQGASLFLVTNRHVVTGLHQDTRQPMDPNGATPQFLDIVHNSNEGLGSWVVRRERLYDYEIEPLWLEHPHFGSDVDVVALPLTSTDGTKPYPYDPWMVVPEVQIEVTTELSIVGFPYGQSGGGRFAIWTRGTIASEPDVSIDERLPRFYVDSRTRSGQSGSPAIIYKSSGGVNMADGSVAFMGGPVCVLVGVYSGRFNKESDLGYIWKVSTLKEILLHGVRPKNPHHPT